MILTEKYLESKTFENFCAKNNVEMIINFDEEIEKMEYAFHFLYPKEGFTDDDHVVYKFSEGALYFDYQYQRDDLENLPQLISNANKLKEFVIYFSTRIIS